MAREVQITVALRKQDFDNNDYQKAQTMKRSRITIDVSLELRKRIKLAAAQNEISISEYLGQILERAVPAEASIIEEEEQPITLEEIENLRRLRKLILQDRHGKPFEDSSEMIRQMREERTRYLEQVREQS